MPEVCGFHLGQEVVPGTFFALQGAPSLQRHANTITSTLPGFQEGVHAVCRDNSPKIVVLVTVFNRVVEQVSGLRFKVELAASGTLSIDGSVNLLSNLTEQEIVITPQDYANPFTVQVSQTLNLEGG
jgi:hypothetical protein